MGILDYLSPIGSVVSGLVGGTADYLTGLSNQKASKEMLQLQNDYNTEMWNKSNEYNTPTNVIQRYQDAGINSGAAASAALGSVASASPVQSSSQNMPSIQGVGSNLVAGFNNAANLLQQVDLVKSEVNKNNAQEDLYKSQNKLTQQETLNAAREFDKISSEISKIGAEQDWTEEQTREAKEIFQIIKEKTGAERDKAINEARQVIKLIEKIDSDIKTNESTQQVNQSVVMVNKSISNEHNANTSLINAKTREQNIINGLREKGINPNSTGVDVLVDLLVKHPRMSKILDNLINQFADGVEDGVKTIDWNGFTRDDFRKALISPIKSFRYPDKHSNGSW